MRLNKFIALATGISRRKADEIIGLREIKINNLVASIGVQVNPKTDVIMWKSKELQLPKNATTILLHKPVGYVCSRDGQGSKTIYDLLPSNLNNLKPIGRLDKDSSGLIMMTDDGSLIFKLSHPKFQKEKIYNVELAKPLSSKLQAMISRQGVYLDDGISKLDLAPQNEKRTKWQIIMSEGRNRQIRRTFEAADNHVAKLHRIKFGNFELKDLEPGEYKITDKYEKIQHKKTK